MFIYEFKALTQSGLQKQGTVKAKNIERAKRRIQEKGLYLSSIELNENIKSQNSSSFGSLIKELFYLNTSRMKL